MKKFMMILMIAGAMASSAFAHHMAVYEDAGIYIPEWSPHLDMELDIMMDMDQQAGLL